ncbi:putative sporulation protein YtxC [Bacillaceae bacterium Marseille-Q3522]|nr:putative sporulation protein YtxC [Bacillaceae bacterium Marseille-Q3522]
MIEIIFQNKEDAGKLYNDFQNVSASVHVVFLQREGKFCLQLNFSDPLMLKKIKAAFVVFIMKEKVDLWLRDILATSFFYTDEEEQQQILQIVHSILEGNRQELAVFLDEVHAEALLKDLIDEFITYEVSFSFESFVTFRLRPFMEQLLHFVEISIDEFKMEQEYQVFIQTLREYLQKRTSHFHHLHVVMDEDILFYNEEFIEMKRHELIRMIDRRLLINHPVYVDSVSIAPLLSIAPLQIYLYTNDPEQPLVRTIQNIFEERLILFTLDDFTQKLIRYSEKKKSDSALEMNQINDYNT